MKLLLLIGLIFSALTPHSASANCQKIPHISGIEGGLEFNRSNFEEEQWGIKVEFLYGDWEWKEDFNRDGLNKYGYFVALISDHAARCLTDNTVGRFLPNEIASKASNQSELIEFMLEDLIAIKAELSEAELNFDQYSENLDMVSDSVKERLRSNIYKATENLARAAALEVNWYIELLGDFNSNLETMRSGLVSTRSLISNYLLTNPRIKNLVFDRLKNNTYQVTDTYGAFFGDEQKKQIIEAINKVESVQDPVEVLDAYNKWADFLEAMISNMYEESEVFRGASTKLKFVFGDKIHDFFDDAQATQIISRIGES